MCPVGRAPSVTSFSHAPPDDPCRTVGWVRKLGERPNSKDTREISQPNGTPSVTALHDVTPGSHAGRFLYKNGASAPNALQASYLSCGWQPSVTA